MEYGVMIDVSRGKVYNVETLKRIMKLCKNFGYTYINLYIEDLLEIDGYPQYGYMRGKFSDEEIKELVAYANEIEMGLYPAIQTLGHLEHFLKWQDSDSIADTKKVLNVTNEKTLAFINKLITKCQTLFDSDKINVGMDEAFDLGMGSVFRKLGTIDQKKLYFEHLNNVLDICTANGYKTVKVWSDMVFSVYANKGGEALYAKVDDNQITALDNRLQLVYWNYWTRDVNEYEQVIDMHRKFTPNVSVALGIHTWGEAAYINSQIDVTKAALSACANKKIDDILFTMWGDDGSLYNLDTAIYGMYITSCHMLNKQISKDEFEQMTSINFESAKLFSNISSLGINALGVLWNDPITNIYFNSVSNEHLKQVYDKCASQLSSSDDELAQINNLYVEIIKREILLYLESQVDDKLLDLYDKLLVSFENLWRKEAKLAGIEEIQKRLVSKKYRLSYLFTNISDCEIVKTKEDRTYTKYNIHPHYNNISTALNNRW